MASSDIIVFFWPGSPWASKVTSYLALRNIPYAECHQPIIMPRPDLEALGVNYRRVPVVAIGRDIYCDSLLILQKLEEFYSPSDSIKARLGAETGEAKFYERLIEKWTDVVVFPRAAADCIPLDHPLLDDKFVKDREALWGEKWDRETRAKKRPAALVNMRECFDLLEHTILSDGRKWISGETGPLLADIHGAWIFDWMMALDGAWPEDLISNKLHPNTFAWAERYHKAVEAASNKNEVIEGPEALKRVTAAQAQQDKGVESHDPMGIKAGSKVEVGPLDTGFSAPIIGTLAALNPEEVVVRTSTRPSDGTQATDVSLHCPRWNFGIKAA